MQLVDRYLARELFQALIATLIVLLMIMMGAAFTDVLRDIMKGAMPARLIFAQLGLVVIGWLPLILPMSLLLGTLLAVSRLYRDAEMPVLNSIGVGPRRLLRPLLLVAGPTVALVALTSLFLGPWAERTSRRMVLEANRNMLISGLEAGKFTALPNGGGVVYVGDMSGDGSRFKRVFIYREKNARADITTSTDGTLWLDGSQARYLRLKDGFEVEGPLGGGALDYRLLRYASNDVRMPDSEKDSDANAVKRQPTLALLGHADAASRAELHWRMAAPLLALAMALLAVPLARSPPRQPRYGRMVLGVLGYLVAVQLLMLGQQWLTRGRLPIALGLWWLLLPLLAFACWSYMRDGSLRRARA